MDEKIVMDSMELILNSGNGKTLAIEAVKSLIKDNNIEEARKKLKEAENEIGKAHNIQTGFLHKEMSGENLEKSILLIHAQDHFMNAMTIKDMAVIMVDMYEKLNK
ncbi:PTS lactose/cellobiose transporter subunit IIA [Eubacterium multiforme]|uniref:PTS system cellobiose-specific IIA component n=1 Tax=Eubacterium multiforme TaxID=83339 RepID=A0ABT9UXN4_9FIRM|nr:PTS lactose/cellobiose transporter subunit IIA [Eubacterium multiforme]MDQ0151084.1 PTS system cellobiose-specific IIA component [Eubacterium multiforme]